MEQTSGYLPLYFFFLIKLHCSDLTIYIFFKDPGSESGFRVQIQNTLESGSETLRWNPSYFKDPTLNSVLRIRIYYYAEPDPNPGSQKCLYGSGSKGVGTKEEKLHQQQQVFYLIFQNGIKN